MESINFTRSLESSAIVEISEIYRVQTMSWEKSFCFSDLLGSAGGFGISSRFLLTQFEGHRRRQWYSLVGKWKNMPEMMAASQRFVWFSEVQVECVFSLVEK